MRAMVGLSGFLWRQWPSLILAGLLAALVSNGLFGPRGPRDLLILRHAYTRLEAQSQRLQAENAKLNTKIQNLRSNNRYIQILIRRELGFTRPDELVYKFAPASRANTNR